MLGLGACRACAGSSAQATDTVRVSFPPPEAEGQEAANLAQQEGSEYERQQAELEEQQRAEEEARVRAEEELAEAERQRLAEEERRRCLAVEEEERRRQVAAEEERKREAEQRRLQEAEEVRRAAEEARKREELQQWLSKAGVSDVNERKRKSGLLSSGFTYPLHMAVKCNDPSAVALLMWAGVDKDRQDSKKRTPLMLAQKLDKKGSHSQVVAALAA